MSTAKCHRFRHRRRQQKEIIHDNEQCKKVILLGNPNVGKSAVFCLLTGTYVTVSNYPGTTVEVYRGFGAIDGITYEVIDTPGMYSLLSISEEEKVARNILLSERPDIAIQIIDAKNLERMLPLTFQIIETGLPLIIILNMMDEADSIVLHIDWRKIADILNVPVVPMVAVEGRGQEILRGLIAAFKPAIPLQIKYDSEIEEAINKLEDLLPDNLSLSKRSISVLLLEYDISLLDMLKSHALSRPTQHPAEAGRCDIDINKINEIVRNCNKRHNLSVNYITNSERQKVSKNIANQVITEKEKDIGSRIKNTIDKITLSPWTGIPLLFLVLYFGLYKFVGGFGAGVLVDFIEGTIFEQHINVFLTEKICKIIPWLWLQELFVHEYGILTLGLRYAIAIVLPIVSVFFLFFALLEDSGYFPRLAMLVDRLFKLIGLNGRAVIPMVLGLGCDTMAVIVTRILETKRERIIAIFLLSLAVPCSAQLGLIIGILSQNTMSLIIWASYVLIIFCAVGVTADKILPGNLPSFYMELPPLRIPSFKNVLIKTYTRIKWYFMEILPLFIFVSVLIWLCEIANILDLMISALSYFTKLLGLPDEIAKVFLFGFLRRDYGAAGLYDLHRVGALNTIQLTVGAVTLTLFLPCVAQLMIMKKELGWKITIAMVALIMPLAFISGFILNSILSRAVLKL